ncbi:hypothetical protein FHU10_5070 [Serratia fonticola]|uniref:Uncharacterized protein n=1 Tax=Serratia fonticola TaxID=47917 RepID=A0A542D498_SERFO|nr:hypothetical protein [Serratia fonticola]TQI80077.1 hypothetical protein FHU09_2634 [Serratia fonticola]TQI97899.1 hypothetical protein FHU11_3411 [Serratia fonticola]TVZ72395.1 hypothetical protein FHU10_5070 [Serratia fonticola]
MSKFDLKTQNEISILVGFLSALDEEVISDNDYLLIKNKNVNNESDLRSISDIILKPWFLEYVPANRDKVIQSINFIISGELSLADVVLSEVNFTFDHEIKDKLLFLTRVKSFLKEYSKDNC